MDIKKKTFSHNKLRAKKSNYALFCMEFRFEQT